MTHCVGIDVGTTYTAAAVARSGRAEVVTLGHRATSVPGEQPLLVLAGSGTLRALAPDGATAWEAEVTVEPSAVTAAPGVLAVTDFAGNVAGYRL